MGASNSFGPVVPSAVIFVVNSTENEGLGVTLFEFFHEFKGIPAIGLWNTLHEDESLKQYPFVPWNACPSAASFITA